MVTALVISLGSWHHRDSTHSFWSSCPPPPCECRAPLPASLLCLLKRVLGGSTIRVRGKILSDSVWSTFSFFCFPLNGIKIITGKLNLLVHQPRPRFPWRDSCLPVLLPLPSPRWPLRFYGRSRASVTSHDESCYGFTFLTLLWAYRTSWTSDLHPLRFQMLSHSLLSPIWTRNGVLPPSTHIF